MDKIARLRQEIERRINILTNVYAEQVERKDEEMMNYYHGKVIALEELRPFLDTLSEEPDKSLEVELEKESPKELDEMIDDYFKSLFPNIAYYKWRTSDVYVHASPDGIRFLCDHFYELGQSQMPMPEDTVLFQKGVAEGRRLEKEDMLKDAEECELYWDGDFLAIDLNMVALGYSEKDKVKVIVLKDESK